MAVELQERLLHQVLGLGRRHAAPPEAGPQARRVPPVQLAEAPLLAAHIRDHQRLVTHLHHHAPTTPPIAIGHTPRRSGSRRRS